MIIRAVEREKENEIGFWSVLTSRLNVPLERPVMPMNSQLEIEGAEKIFFRPHYLSNNVHTCVLLSYAYCIT